MEHSVRKAVDIIRSRYCDPITLNEVAAEVFVSPYHFSRIFSRAVGLTPGRYLTAVRLFAAKRMLLTTDLTVSDIVCSVGYNSVGTFTSRFTRAVGMSPTRYRDPAVLRLLVAVSRDFARFPDLTEMVELSRHRTKVSQHTASVRGTLDLPEGVSSADVLVGVFPQATPQGTPLAFAALSAYGRTDFEVPHVPDGSYYLIVVAMPQGNRDRDAPLLKAVTRGCIKIASGLRTHVYLPLEPVEETDPPVAVTLADVAAMRTGSPEIRSLRQTVA